MIFVLNPIYLYPVPVPLFLFRLVSPEFCYRPGLSAVSEDGAGSGGGGGAPTRPLPPTPDDDDAHPDRTLVMKRVSVTVVHSALFVNSCVYLFRFYRTKLNFVS